MTLISGFERDGDAFQGIQVETQSPYHRGPGFFRRSWSPARWLGFGFGYWDFFFFFFDSTCPPFLATATHLSCAVGRPPC